MVFRDEEQPVEESWDKKKIVVTLFLLVIVGVGVFQYRGSLLKVIPQDTSESFVLGASAEQNTTPGFSSASAAATMQSMSLQDSLMNIKDQVTKLDPSELGSSSPQVQKILNDIQALQGLPRNQAREACENLCKNL